MSLGQALDETPLPLGSRHAVEHSAPSPWWHGLIQLWHVQQGVMCMHEYINSPKKKNTSRYTEQRYCKTKI